MRDGSSHSDVLHNPVTEEPRSLFHHGARVVVRDPEQTEMVVQGSGPARAFAKQLFKKGKAFRAEPSDDGHTWTFLIDEYNWPTKWEDH